MKNYKFTSGMMLAAVTGIALLAGVAARAFVPRLILPKPDASAVILLSLAALVLEHYLGEGRRDYRLAPLWSALSFGLLPLAAGFVSPLDALKLAVLGAVIYTLAAFLYDGIVERLSSSPASRLAPLVSGVGLWLAAQCIVGIV